MTRVKPLHYSTFLFHPFPFCHFRLKNTVLKDENIEGVIKALVAFFLPYSIICFEDELEALQSTTDKMIKMREGKCTLEDILNIPLSCEPEQIYVTSNHLLEKVERLLFSSTAPVKIKMNSCREIMKQILVDFQLRVLERKRLFTDGSPTANISFLSVERQQQYLPKMEFKAWVLKFSKTGHDFMINHILTKVICGFAETCDIVSKRDQNVAIVQNRSVLIATESQSIEAVVKKSENNDCFIVIIGRDPEKVSDEKWKEYTTMLCGQYIHLCKQGFDLYDVIQCTTTAIQESCPGM